MAHNPNKDFVFIDGVDCSGGLVSVSYGRKSIGTVTAANDSSKNMTVNPDKGRTVTITWRWYAAQRGYLTRLADAFLNEEQTPFNVTTGNTHSGFRGVNSSCVITDCDDMPGTNDGGEPSTWSAVFQSGTSNSDYSGLQTAGRGEFTG